ncbi:MAG: insulinase family protein [Candidatus Tectomicrobia bacterium]|uniref:Insulinase family protein n=1 Tax=Tectimicrobiota bacterium TaxID=2528274 RepID=A0A932FUT8_UNCTE|nr:insulinase family protein [Candidatus Tectomicrobia bacterium]
MTRHPARLSRLLALVYLLVRLGLPEHAAQAVPPVQRMVLPNQLVLLVSKEHSLPLVTLQLSVDAGAWRDPQGAEGLAYMTASGLLQGTSTHTATALHEELTFLGAFLQASSGRDYATVRLQVLQRNLDRGIDLFLEVLTQPAFPEEEIRRGIEQTVATVQAAEGRPQQVVERAFEMALFLAGPYGHPVEGTPTSLPRLTREGLIAFHRTYYRPNNAILTVVGDITREEIAAKLLPRLAAWPAGKIPEMALRPQFAQGPKTVQIDRPVTQAHIVVGHAGIRRGNPDFYALSVMSYILGGRLVHEIQSKRGLTYAVNSLFDLGRYPGAFRIVLQTKNASAREAISLALQRMERMRQVMVSEEELERAKRYLVGRFRALFGTQAGLADLLGEVEYYRLGLDYLERYPSLVHSVTREDVLRVARAYLHPESPILVVVAHLKEAGLDEPGKSPPFRSSGP